MPAMPHTPHHEVETYEVVDTLSILLLASVVTLHHGTVDHVRTGTHEDVVGFLFTVTGPRAMHDMLAADFDTYTP